MAFIIYIDASKATKGLQGAQENLYDFSEFFRNVADLELSDTKLRFDKQVDPNDKPWPDPITIRRDAGGNRGGFTREQSWNYVLKSNFHAVPKGWHWFDRNRDKVLRDTGTLFNSLSRDFGKDFAIVGTDLSYAEKLQTGRFPFIGITSRTESNLDIAMNAFLKGAFK